MWRAPQKGARRFFSVASKQHSENPGKTARNLRKTREKKRKTFEIYTKKPEKNDKKCKKRAPISLAMRRDLLQKMPKTPREIGPFDVVGCIVFNAARAFSCCHQRQHALRVHCLLGQLTPWFCSAPRFLGRPIHKSLELSKSHQHVVACTHAKSGRTRRAEFPRGVSRRKSTCSQSPPIFYKQCLYEHMRWHKINPP